MRVVAEGERAEGWAGRRKVDGSGARVHWYPFDSLGWRFIWSHRSTKKRRAREIKRRGRAGRRTGGEEGGEWASVLFFDVDDVDVPNL